MYKVSAHSRQEYISEATRAGRDIEALDMFIRESAPDLQPWFYDVGPHDPGMTFKMLGYGMFTYKPKKSAADMIQWPVIGVAIQKNYISIYISITRDDKPLLDFYRTDLGCTRSGNNNFSFETFGQLDKDALKKLLQEVETIFKHDATNPVRFKESR